MGAIVPYLNFDGNCREAMKFYNECLGGDLALTTFGEVDAKTAPESRDRLMHARITKDSKVLLMASDTMTGMPYVRGTNFWLSLGCDTDQEVDKLYGLLAAGGKESMAPHDAFWNARFAMFTDKYGINWMLNHERMQPA
ncbi:MAG: VOC family protein [Gemmatimonadota bacterium]|nr:VOC family protein [Gemmatimonadota bacterium]